MDQLADAATMRQWSQRCFAKAQECKDQEERERLQKMGIALLEVAQTRDWLDGRKSAIKAHVAERTLEEVRPSR